MRFLLQLNDHRHRQRILLTVERMWFGYPHHLWTGTIRQSKNLDEQQCRWVLGSTEANSAGFFCVPESSVHQRHWLTLLAAASFLKNGVHCYSIIKGNRRLEMSLWEKVSNPLGLPFWRMVKIYYMYISHLCTFSLYQTRSGTSNCCSIGHFGGRRHFAFVE